MGACVIRSVEEREIGILLSLIKQLASFEKLEHEVTVTEERLAQALFGNPPACEAVFALVDEQPAGFALFFHNYSTFTGLRGLYLEDLYVTETFRGQGIGQNLFEFVANVAQKRGCPRLDWAVLDWNKQAHLFYEKRGASPLRDWVLYRINQGHFSP